MKVKERVGGERGERGEEGGRQTVCQTNKDRETKKPTGLSDKRRQTKKQTQRDWQRKKTERSMHGCIHIQIYTYVHTFFLLQIHTYVSKRS